MDLGENSILNSLFLFSTNSKDLIYMHPLSLGCIVTDRKWETLIGKEFDSDIDGIRNRGGFHLLALTIISLATAPILKKIYIYFRFYLSYIF